ncbi:bifunctional tRNA (5-methylaminomethyl-2-thiouridine)(34)-methyltransferase MnmD/FAD-dependent 5-carboxymethylaminomethyl-2-thiouridine(34) oxidoreductase MnmC [Legionella geestiana]|nr:bifunctional tRNA (5-methylaminomethyl-2-thiouridine)(34)-methyltransferase MnmD/FAD-dependent 5-carboxymethylaminomethyl-2-thiouridine(34) oxidoreductase MnmC [Legionella geestiana]
MPHPLPNHVSVVLSRPLDPIVPADLSWRDGLPYSPAFEDVYFLPENGPAEVRHVFVDGNQLIERWQALPRDAKSHFVIAETGFGSGLNALVTIDCWLKNAPADAHLYYYSCEKYPLKREDFARCMALWPQYEAIGAALLEACPMLVPGMHQLKLSGLPVTLMLMLGDATDMYTELLTSGEAETEKAFGQCRLDAIFLDGFSPAKNPAMWTQTLFNTLGLLAHDTATLATFSCARAVCEGLGQAGFMVSKVPGFGRKRRMLVARKSPNVENRTIRKTPWHVNAKRFQQRGRALVAGAGLAGAFVADALARRGWEVVVLEREANPAGGASGNPQAVLYPMFSSHDSPMSRFFLMAFPQSARRLRALHGEGVGGDFSGILQLAMDNKTRQEFARLRPLFAHCPDVAQWVDAAMASRLAGIPLRHEALFVPAAGWMDARALCTHLLSAPNIQVLANTPVETIHRENSLWYAGGQTGDILVIACGIAASRYPETSHLTLKPLRGQMSGFESTSESRALLLPVCGDGHVLPAVNGVHLTGATYFPGVDSSVCSSEDDARNMARLATFVPDVSWPDAASTQWAGVRAVTPDYLPLVGPVADVGQFSERFAPMRRNAKCWLSATGAFHEGLYICAGFGSRALTSAPLCAEFLAESLDASAPLLPRSIQQALSPARFLVRALIRSSV